MAVAEYILALKGTLKFFQYAMEFIITGQYLNKPPNTTLL